MYSARFLLLFIGLGSMLYNIQAAVSNFEFVLNFSSLTFCGDRADSHHARHRRRAEAKTDQLLYALPISTVQVIIGKYLALLILFLIPWPSSPSIR